MWVGKERITINGTERIIQAVHIERGEKVSPEELVQFARENGLIYSIDGKERVNIIFLETGKLRFGYLVEILTVFFLGVSGKK